ncbi:SGNH/GDSL hydrolase family protein [Rothia sp. ZJ1223]|uniref:SGNH/GDSL hydrolase family protein n=1 Tax=Rothia sp. ZJ1223 TaxID=2811098 RepID=UPI00195ACF9C|nr:SGNH/GDSL hydrolase family protein [Rothia sp. ZJ1223]MBM7050592.1 gamma-glutamylcyclotransferase [Rothia sp. ZJ1223]
MYYPDSSGSTLTFSQTDEDCSDDNLIIIGPAENLVSTLLQGKIVSAELIKLVRRAPYSTLPNQTHQPANRVYPKTMIYQLPLFSFGTLLDPAVQQYVFGSTLTHSRGSLANMHFTEVPINDPAVIAASGLAVHRGLASHLGSSIDGGLLALSSEQLTQADAYEVSAYARRRVLTTDGNQAWAYLNARPLASAERIGIIGDGIAYGRSDARGGWAQLLHSTHLARNEDRHRLWNFAIPGEKLSNLADYAPAELARRSIDTVIIGAGINDLIAGTSSAALLQEVENLCTILEVEGRRPVVLTPLWLNTEQAAQDFGVSVSLSTVLDYRNLLLTWGTRTYRDVIDLYPVLEELPEYLIDGIHPDAGGHELIYQALSTG